MLTRARSLLMTIATACFAASAFLLAASAAFFAASAAIVSCSTCLTACSISLSVCFPAVVHAVDAASREPDGDKPAK
jgi:hypothetical protein